MKMLTAEEERVSAWKTVARDAAPQGDTASDPPKHSPNVQAKISFVFPSTAAT